VKRFSIVKLWNILLVQLSFFLSSILKLPIVWGRPWFVSIEPSSVCNLRCPQCPVGKGDISRRNKFLDINVYKSLLSEIAPTTTILSLYFQGEPLMHMQFVEFIRLASDHGIYTQTSSNGQLLTEELCRQMVEAGLDRIIVSVDGADQESYEAYRKGGDLGRAEEGVRNLVRMRKELGTRSPRIILQFLVMRHNQEQVQAVRKRAKELGADKVWIKSVQLEYPESGDEFIPEDHSRYVKNEDGEWQLKGRLKNRCKRLWHTTVVTSDGLVVPCCFDKRAEFPLGDANGSGMDKIWRGKAYREFRKGVLADRKGNAICMNCSEGIGRLYR
jgi:radical SAM protein with 4Fe4S-binding SPASM domain